MGCKEWQRPGAWDRVVEHLKLLGYRVVQLPGPRKGIKGVPDMEQVPGTELCPEQDLVRGALTYLAHCEFFVGLASGLAWLARSLNKEVVMVSGFSDAYTEFRSRCWRVINSQVCNSCYNDTGVEYGRHWEWCPREKAFECTREIAPETVNTAVAAASLARSVELPEKPRLLCILPHCSTGGCPQYFLTKLRVLRTAYDVYVVEWSFQGAQFSTQRNQIRMLCKEFIEFDDARHQDLYALVEDLKPEVIHFEELPSMYSRPETLHRLHDEGRYRIFHTSHCSIKQVIRSRPEKYVFPSAAQVAMYGEGEVLEHPVMDKFYAGAPSRDVLCLGILSAHKNQKYVCELARKMPDVQFHFCGATAPNFRDYWKDFLPKPLTVPGERYGFANCTFYGECGPGTLEGLYRRCPVLLHASTLECLPLVFSEALSHGTAVLANWLPIYEHISFKDRISKSRLNLDEDAAKVRELLQVPRVRTEPNYEQFKQRLLDLYS
jgi:glycosyltransferase involved in cell wall biosynthesis